MSEKLTCQELEGWLVAVADDSASAEESAAVRLHIASCPACTRSLDQARSLLGNLRQADPTPERSERFWQELEADTLARVRTEALPSLADARKRREVRRPMAWLAGGFVLAAAAAVAIFYVALRLRSHQETAQAPAPVAPAPATVAQDDTPREDPALAGEPDDESDSDMVDTLADDMGESELANLAEDLDGQAPELADLGDSADVDSDTASAEWAPAEGAPTEHMLDELTPEQLARVYDELSKTDPGSDAGPTGG